MIELQAMKVLVTGGTGFIGSYLVKALVKRGYDVSCLVRDKNKAGNLASLKLKLVEGDVTDKKAVEKAVAGMDIVYHLAAISGKSAVSPSLYQKVNIEGTRNLVEAALKAKVGRFVYTSSVAVTGQLSKIPGDETSPYNSTNSYERSKVEGEKLVLAAMKRGLPAVIVRPGVVYGPGNEHTSMAQFFRMALKGFCLIPGNGENLWDLIFVDDIVAGFLLAGEKKQAVGQIFIIRGPQPVKVNQLVKTLAHASGVKLKIIHLPLLPMIFAGKIFGLIESLFGLPMPFSAKTVQILSQSRPHSIEKAKTILGYQPKISLEEGVAKTVVGYKEKGFL